MGISKKVVDRMSAQLRRYKAALADAKSRDVNESDTVVIIGDMLADLFGYKKYSEITTELAIRGTYVDLAVKVDNELRFLVEAKAINAPLKESYVKQAIDYGANNGIEWVVLTNGAVWQFYKIHFRQPIDKSLVYEIDLLNVDPKDDQMLECFGTLAREEFTKQSMSAFFQQQQAISRFSLAAALLSPSVIRALRRELRLIAPKLRVEDDYLSAILENEVLKRDVVTSDEAQRARAAFARAARAEAKDKESVGVPAVPAAAADAQELT
ncbi:MAG: type I restriction enzyme HsdR N-terminal domain-containing protein [Rhodospirillales bacterium]|nr:type I restriction enzyme HsdR N-terminal domain-containing protein [Rhodospirillales bacterium]